MRPKMNKLKNNNKNFVVFQKCSNFSQKFHCSPNKMLMYAKKKHPWLWRFPWILKRCLQAEAFLPGLLYQRLLKSSCISKEEVRESWRGVPLSNVGVWQFHRSSLFYVNWSSWCQKTDTEWVHVFPIWTDEIRFQMLLFFFSCALLRSNGS